MNIRNILKVSGVTLFVIIAALFYSCKSRDSNSVTMLDGQDPILSNSFDLEQAIDTEEEKEDVIIYVHICGAVKNPAVYIVKENTRLVDLILLAGGLTADAASESVNQASILLDGQQIYIPTKEEIEEGFVEDSKSTSDTSSKKININKASLDELMTLPGIGKSKAESIIEYRSNNNGFKTIEDIKNISGIKDAVFDKISDKIDIK